MPDFSVDSWTSFKEQFMSVIRFILYCFDLFFDSVRSRPLLYTFFFFPIFAAALLILLSVSQRLFMVPESSDVGFNRRGFGVLRIHGNKSDSKAIAVNLATTNHKLDSIDHKLGKVSTSAKLSSGKGSSAGFGKGAAVGTGKGASAGMGKGSSANSIGSADTGLSISRGIRNILGFSKTGVIARFKRSKFYEKHFKGESGGAVNLTSSDNNLNNSIYNYDSSTTLNDSKYDIDVDD